MGFLFLFFRSYQTETNVSDSLKLILEVTGGQGEDSWVFELGLGFGRPLLFGSYLTLYNWLSPPESGFPHL